MYDNNDVVKKRPNKADLDPYKPYLFLHEEEPGRDGTLKSVNALFLTNKECPFKCVMCDLWKHTLDDATPPGAIPHQIEYALRRLPEAHVVKLYNNGNFFDRSAIPAEDYKPISRLLEPYERVIVENHPKLCNDAIPRFQEMLDGQLEVAIGLETTHPEVLPRLNKQISLQNFSEAVGFLNVHGIDTRAFILLNPPFLSGKQNNIEWCVKSVEFAFETGIQTCSIIPTRGGNGIMEELEQSGDFEPPRIDSFEEAFELALELNMGYVLADTWDLSPFSSCNNCFQKRKERLDKMNLTQSILPKIGCHCQHIN